MRWWELPFFGSALLLFNAWAIIPDIGQPVDAIFRFDFMIISGFILALWALVRTVRE